MVYDVVTLDVKTMVCWCCNEFPKNNLNFGSRPAVTLKLVRPVHVEIS